MATTITSNEGLSSSTPPDQIPSFTPEAYAEEQSFEKDLLRPSIEAEKKYQEEGLKIRQENYHTIRKHARDFDKFEPTVSPEIKSRVLVSGYIDSMFPENDRPSNDHDILRDSIAKHKFNGAGVGDDEAFLEAMRGDFDRQDKEQGFWDDLDRRATLSAMVGGGQPLIDFKKWVWSDENSEFTKANRMEINDRWQRNQDAIREKFGVDMLHDLRTTFNDMGAKDQWLALAWRRTKDYSDEEKDLFIASLRDLATEYPSGAGNSFLANFGTSARRGVTGALDKGSEAAMEFFRNAAVGAHSTFITPWPEVFGGDEGKQWAKDHKDAGKAWLREEMDGVDWAAELRDTYEQDWDPVRGIEPKDTWLRDIEDGIYSIPGSLTTFGVAFVPVVGMPLSFGMMKQFDREKYRREILSNGGSREDAYNLAGGMSMVSAVPNMLLEKFQSYGLTGRIPGMGKVFGKIDDIFANKLGRFGTKMFVAGAAETTVELTQQATTDLVQDITNSLKEFNPIVPDIEWKNGKDGHFDGYFSKTLTTFVAVAPLGVIVAGRGMTMESRAEALKTTSPLERKAFGITEEASAKLDEAKTPREMVEAFHNAVKTREPWSEAAHEGVMELERMHEMRSKTNEDSEKFGVSPAVRRAPDSNTFEVFDRTTGDTIAEVNTAQEATEEVFNQLQLKAEENSHYFEELQAAFEAASLDVEQSGEAVEVGTGKHTDAEVELASLEAGRRLQTERELIEQRNGGTGEVAQEVMSEGDTSSGTVAGSYTPGDQMSRKEAVLRIYNGSSVLTLLHERGHAKRRKLMATGAWTRADQISSLMGLDNFITKADEKFLPENFAELSEYKQEVALDEAAAELAEVLGLMSRKGKHSKMGKLIKRSMSAMVQARVPGAAQLSSFIETMGKFFGLQLRRATLLKKAVRDGKLDQAQLDQLTDMLVGEDSQEAFEQEREQIPVEMIDGQEVDVPFSPGRADMLSNITPADTSYRIQHQPSSDDATLNDLAEMFGEDIYGPNAAQYYGAGMTGESEVLDIFKKVRGNPEAKVTIYRVVPAFADQINAGDWVTISRAAADEMNNAEFLGSDPRGNPQESKIISKVVTAKEITWPGDSMQEQGYFPDQSRDEISFSPGDARMLSDLSENVMRRVRAPESRAVVFEKLIDRIDAQRRDVAKMIFGGTVVQEAIPDARSMKSLKKEAAFRQAARHDELEMELDAEMRTLGADLAVSVKDMPVHSALIDGGYKLTTKRKAVKDGRMQDTDGDFDDVEGLHPSVFGGDTMPDVAAQALAGFQQDGQVILQEGTVSELYDALAQEWQQVQENRQMNKDAKKKLRDTGKQARAESNKWLDEAIAKQKKHYNPVARIRRSLVMYDAILKTLPPELRGKMGGFVQIGKLNSDKARLEFLEKKLDQLDVEVDKWISGLHRKQIEKIFEANKPKKKSNGPSKVNSDALYADQVIEIKAISEMTQEEVDAAIEDVDGDIEKNTEEWELEELVTRRDKLSVFGNIDGMKANALGDFYQNLNTIHKQGKLLKSITDAQFNAFLEETVGIVNEDVTGGQGQISQSESKRLDEARKSKTINLKWIGAQDVELDGLSDFHRKNLSFEWLLNAISRANKAVETMRSMTNQRLGTMVHLATTAADRGEMALTEEYREALASIFGVRAGGQRNIIPALENKISALEKVGETNVFKMEYEGDSKSNTRTIPMSKVQAIIDNKATLDGLGLSDADWSAIKASHAELIKGRQAKEDAKAETAKRKPKKVTLTASTKITYESPVDGDSKPMALSQSQGINLSMLWRQDGLKGSMEHEGYSEKTMEQLEDFLTDESKEIRAWLTIKYDENYHKINKVFRAQNGFSLPKIDFYAPALRMANKEAKDMSIDSQGRQAMSVSPEFIITRTQNKAPMDQTAGALSIYMSHALQTNHYVSWADTVKVLRSVFSNKDVRANIKGYVGVSALQTIEERIQWFADGGNRKATHIKLMDSLRAAHTYNSLSFKWSILAKQLSSLPAYAFDMGFKDFSKYAMKWWKHPIENLRSMWNTEYVKTRFKKGYERDVIDGLNNRGKASVLRKALQVGMLSGKVGDIIPVMIGGWIAREQAYDAARAGGLSKADAQRKAEITFEMVSDRSQQAGGLKDLSSFQGGGSFFKLFTMYKTSPRQYYANVYESLLDAGGVKGLIKGTGKKGSRAQFTRRFLISHVILPMSFQFISDLTRMGLRPDDEDAFSAESYFRAMLLGPLNGVFIFGDGIDLLASAVAGTTLWEKVMPILGGPTEIARGIMDIGDGDFLEGIDEVARGIGKMTPSALTFYDIITDEAKRLYLID